MDAADLKHLERYGELGPNVLARLGKNAHRNGLIVEQYLKHQDRYGPTIVFAADTLHAQTLAGEFQKRGVVKTDYVDYSRKNSSEIIDKYSRRELDVIVNVQMLTEGFDAPHTRTVNDRANLVTFLDTWSQYDVLGPEYALANDAMPPPEVGSSRDDLPLVIIPPELVRDAYRLLQSNVKGQLAGVHACTPHGWYRWEEEFEDDVQSRTVMVFDTQREALLALLEAYANTGAIPETISEDFARGLIRRFFADIPDPLPRWTDVKALLDGRRKACELVYVTFDEKKAFDPVELAKSIVEAKMDPYAEAERLAQVWAENPACAVVYRQDEAAFREEVGRERTKLMNARLQRPKTDPVVAAIVPQSPPRPWPEGDHGRSLSELLAAVIAVKRHFPAGAPMLGELRWMNRTSKRLWGFFRFQDKCVALNPLLDSPDVPRFVVEFVLYHELLHGDMPSAGHNPDFRARERESQAKRGSNRCARVSTRAC
jgi:hypothetical protein